MQADRFSIFTKNELGLIRDNSISLSQHNPNWKKVFESESKLLKSSLKIDSLELYHCGSTAIPGIVAKPIIDIVGSVADLEEVDRRKALIEEIGYEYKGEYGINGRRYSVLYNLEKTIGFCHLHIFQEESKELSDHILFKDYLINNPNAAKRYEEIKLSLNLPRSEYSNAKAPIITELLKEAQS